MHIFFFRKINLQHEFIKQSKMIRRDLFVINEAVETVEETEFRESSNAEGNIFYDTCINLKLKVRFELRPFIK